ncbi:hypothetical protein C496_00640 [Natronorubrum tibetense GA33]|uniref:Uncharacterized protein n=1 Tax=Natronorubrum tibetense GA33 TaxID=1114856 RepID=L9WAU8_9EURY|nr:hypothetical protein C496_00640 [Natronorubrum tibetense GA33]
MGTRERIPGVPLRCKRQRRTGQLNDTFQSSRQGQRGDADGDHEHSVPTALERTEPVNEHTQDEQQRAVTEMCERSKHGGEWLDELTNPLVGRRIPKKDRSFHSTDTGGHTVKSISGSNVLEGDDAVSTIGDDLADSELQRVLHPPPDV